MAELFNIPLLCTHLLALNLASAGPLICIWLGRRGDEQNPDRNPSADRIGKMLARLSLGGLLVGMATGGLQIWLAPPGGVFDAINRLPRRALWFAALELLFSLMCLAAYLGSWEVLRKHRWWHASLALLSSSNLVYHFPPLMSVLGKLAVDPAWAKAEILDRAALLPLMMRTEVLALTTHFALASVAVAAVMVLWITSNSHTSENLDEVRPIQKNAAWIALFTTALQLAVGMWLLTTLQTSARTALLGENLIASCAFVFGLLLTLMLLQQLLTIALGNVPRKELRRPCWMMVLLVLLMTTSLAGTRQSEKTRVVPKSVEADQATKKP